MKAAAQNAMVRERVDVNDEHVILRCSLDAGPLVFAPGQFAVIGLSDDAPRFDAESAPSDGEPHPLIRRAYSIASAPHEPELELFVSLVVEGALTPRLFALRPGDRLFVAPKAAGHLTLDGISTTAPIVLLATGTGIAPFVSMLRAEAHERTRRQFIVVHSVRFERDLAYDAELTRLDARGVCRYVPVVTRGTSAWGGARVRIPELVASGELERRTGVRLDPAATHVFLCGNPGMVDAVRGLLVSRGYLAPRGGVRTTLHFESYA